jgi:predicted ATPase
MTVEALRGRSGELATLDTLAQRVARGRSTALVIAGDPGVGKSALLEHWMERIPTPERKSGG